MSKKKASKPKFHTEYRSVETGELITKSQAAKLLKSQFTTEKVKGPKPRFTTVYRDNQTGELISKKAAAKLPKSRVTVEQMATGGHGTAASDLKSRTVYRDNVTGHLITEAQAKARNADTYTVERLPFDRTGYRTLYRDAVTGKVISKADAMELAKNVYTIDEVPIDPTDPSLFGLNVELNGDWGTTPVVSADKGSDDKRGTIRITPGEQPRTDPTKAPGFTFTFKKARGHKPFAIVACWRQLGADTPPYVNAVNSTSNTVTATGLTVTEYGSLVSGAQIVYDYLVTD